MYAEEEYLITRGQHSPSLPVDADTEQMASVQPQVSSPRAALRIPPLPHTALTDSWPRTRENENTHYCALNPWVGGRGGGAALIGQLTLRCV